ncbi:MAG: acyclic terpene utilization AtuA family protein, partial [Balneolales bacterium]
MKESIKIASGQGFWGDLPNAPIKQVRNGKIDYLVMDYLAEVTMSIMQKQRMRNEEHGYARDFVGVVEEILEEITTSGVRVISNAGGVNPRAC